MTVKTKQLIIFPENIMEGTLIHVRDHSAVINLIFTASNHGQVIGAINAIRIGTSSPPPN